MGKVGDYSECHITAPPPPPPQPHTPPGITSKPLTEFILYHIISYHIISYHIIFGVLVSDKQRQVGLQVLNLDSFGYSVVNILLIFNHEPVE